MPWVTVREAIEGALRARMIERLPESGPWPCDYAGSSNLRLRVAVGGSTLPPTPPTPPPSRPGTRSGEARLQPSQIQDLADAMGELLKARQNYDLGFVVHVDLSGKEAPSDGVVADVNRVLKNVDEALKLE